MKTIRLKEFYGDGYIEVEYVNHASCGWHYFEPDPRKKQCRKPKFWSNTCSFGSVDMLCGRAVNSGSPGWNRLHQSAKRLLMQAARRYDERCAKFGEPSGSNTAEKNADHEILLTALLRVRGSLSSFILPA